MAIEQFSETTTPPKLSLTGEPVSMLSLIHLIRASHNDPLIETYQRNYVLSEDHVPAGLNEHAMSLLGDQIYDLINTTHPRKQQGSHEARKRANQATGRVVGWLGELSVHHHDLTTAKSAVTELRNRGGLRNRQAARQLNRKLKQANSPGHDYPVFGRMSD